MSLADLLHDARENGIHLSLRDGRLAVQAKGGVPPDLLARIKTQRDALVDWLARLAEDAGQQHEAILPGSSPEGEPEPLSYSQSRLWVIDRMENAAGLYNVPFTLRMTGPLDIAALERALARLLDRHAVLRSVFDEGPAGVTQRILTAPAFALPVRQMTAPELAALAEAEAQRPFDLTRDLMMRAILVRLAPEDHRLLLTLHHIATDGWSNAVLLEELIALYHGATLPPPALQFTDYARWQRQMLARRGPALADWWRDTLQGAPDLHDLPCDHPRPPVLSGAGGHLADQVPPALAAAQRDLARAQGVSLFTLLLAVWAAFLHRQTGTEDLVIGTPVAGRERDELKSLVGFLVNTLPLRLRPQPDQRFDAFLAHVNRQTTEALAHQDLPFEMIVEQVNPPRSLSHAPLVQLAFTLVQQALGTTPEISAPGQVRFVATDTATDGAKFELSLGLVDSGNDLRLGWTYATDLFAPATIARYNRAFLSLLEGIAATPDMALTDLPLVSASERARLLDLGTGPFRDVGSNPAEPHALVAHFADTTPDAVAVIWRGQGLTYAALNERVNRLAHHLRALGVQAGDAVAVASGRNAAMIEAMLAVNRAGAAFVLMPVDAPLDRITGILQDSASRLLLTVAERDDLLNLPGVLALALDEDAAWRDLPATAPEPWVNPISYIVYTSGTTGLPKGALNTHLGLLNMCIWQTGDFDMDAGCSQTVVANPAFDAIIWEIWPALTVGGRLILLDAGDLADLAALQAALDRHQPSHFWLPTGLMEAMCSAGLRLPASVRSVATGGDRLQAYCLPEGCGLPLVNIYGPSEAAVFTVFAILQPQDTAQAPIGRPVSNTCVYILDEHGRLLPEGAVGELCLSGPFLGPGYLGRPDLTAQKYVANPFAKPGHEVLYRTGDLARWRPDGRLECLGRTDFQVKIRGYRIEPQEISAVLLTQAGVQAAFVEAVDHGTRHLVAFVVAEAGQDSALMEPALKAALAQRLPSYMMPHRYVWLDALPLTDRGKIDRRALVALAPAPGRQVNTASPRDDLELKLYNIWSSVLLHPDIGLRDNFFDIGGTSLSAIKIVHRINAELGTALAVTEIIAHPTIEALGGVLRAGRERQRPQNPICFRKGAGAVNVVCIHPGGGTAFAYLSLAKELPEDHGVWGIQSVGVYPGDEMLPDIGAMADHYIDLIGDLLDRPLVITGASFGGMVAYEMVRRLRLAGHDTATAVMLDALGSDDPAITQNAALSDAAEFRSKLITYNGMFPGIDDAQIDQYHRIYNHNILSSRRWNFRRSEGRVILIQAIRGRTRAQLRFLRFFWQMRAKGPFLFKCTAGDHSTLLEGNDVRRIAQIIARVLAGQLMPGGRT